MHAARLAVVADASPALPMRVGGAILRRTRGAHPSKCLSPPASTAGGDIIHPKRYRAAAQLRPAELSPSHAELEDVLDDCRSSQRRHWRALNPIRSTHRPTSGTGSFFSNSASPPQR
ncbi:hypothetical protein XACLE3_7720003 [Xanthomonas citri pv. citri]|nr:hypothetical protein XACLE3_7720003 [Xanthomonas citri pv. citri]